MKKFRFAWLLILLVCAGLVIVPAISIWQNQSTSSTDIILLDGGESLAEPGEAVTVSVYDENQQLICTQPAVVTQGRLLVRLDSNDYKSMASAQALRLDSKTQTPVGEAVPVELTKWQGISPREIYRPGRKSREAISYSGHEIPIYKGVEPSQLSPNDFRWSEAHPDRLEYRGEAYTTAFGIDVSAHQNRACKDSTIDWKAVANDGVSFVMVRAGLRGTTSGTLHEDMYFRQNIHGAMEAGLTTGVYFFSQAVTVEEALEEADFVLELLKEEEITGPVAYDWEMVDSSYRIHGTPPEMATACAVAFCERIEEAGYEAIIYAGQHVSYMLYDQGAIEPYARWYPEFKDITSATLAPGLYYQPDCWQFSDRCSIAGIGGYVDGNLSFTPQ